MLLKLLSALDAFAPPGKAGLLQGQGTEQTIDILTLPEEILGMIMSNLNYDEVSQIRLVGRKFNIVAMQELNRGFYRVVKYHTRIMKKFKDQLPRRESERQKHPLSTHCDVLTALDNRLSLMGMTYVKFIDLNKCCFIPGKVLDELFTILRLVESSTSLLKPHIVLSEFRDITTMAMEHFEEQIAPHFDIAKGTGPKLKLACFDTLGAPSCRYGYIQVRCKETAEFERKLSKISGLHKQSKRKLSNARRGCIAAKLKDIQLNRLIADHVSTMTTIKKTINEQSSRITEQEVQIKELENRLVRYEDATKHLMSSLVRLKSDSVKSFSGVIDKCLDVLGETVGDEPVITQKRKKKFVGDWKCKKHCEAKK